MTKSKAKGTSAETLVVKYLQSTYWPYAERRALSGGKDKGDITGTPGLCWEVKAAKTLCVPAWLRETEAERINSGAMYAILVIKPQGVGKERVGELHALMGQEEFARLLENQGFQDGLRVYSFMTKIRSMKIQDALANVEFNKKYHGSAYGFGWVNYPDFALMTSSEYVGSCSWPAMAQLHDLPDVLRLPARRHLSQPAPPEEGSHMTNTAPKFEIRSVGPAEARELLDNTHINRPIRTDQVKAYARDMRAGKWRPVGDPIRIDINGYTIDGQHRLSAIIEWGGTLELVFVVGLEPEDQLVVDSGVKRRPADFLALDGKKYGARAASVGRQLFAVSVDRTYDQKLRVTNEEIFETLRRNPGIIDAVIAVEGIHRQAGITPLNAAVAYAIGTEKIPTTTYLFFEKLRTGAHMASTDPALLLRNRMRLFDANTKAQQLWLILRALELTKLQVESYTKLQLPPGSQITPSVLKEIIDRLRAFKDERLEINA